MVGESAVGQARQTVAELGAANLIYECPPSAHRRPPAPKPRPGPPFAGGPGEGAQNPRKAIKFSQAGAKKWIKPSFQEDLNLL